MEWEEEEEGEGEGGVLILRNNYVTYPCCLFSLILGR